MATVDITGLYVARFGVPPAGKRIFIQTVQQINGWRDRPKTTSARVPAAGKVSNRSLRQGRRMRNFLIMLGSQSRQTSLRSDLSPGRHPARRVDLRRAAGRVVQRTLGGVPCRQGIELNGHQADQRYAIPVPSARHRRRRPQRLERAGPQTGDLSGACSFRAGVNPFSPLLGLRARAKGLTMLLTVPTHAA